MRRLRYSVAASLDGFIAGPLGDYDWIVMDPAIDFAALFAQFDTLVMGRKTFEVMQQGQGGAGEMPGLQVVVFSRTLAASDYPAVTIVKDDPARYVRELKLREGKDIWLFGGGELFRLLLDAWLVDTIEVGLMPILLSEGIPLLPPGRRSPPLKLTKSDTLQSGIVMLSYDVPNTRES